MFVLDCEAEPGGPVIKHWFIRTTDQKKLPSSDLQVNIMLMCTKSVTESQLQKFEDLVERARQDMLILMDVIRLYLGDRD